MRFGMSAWFGVILSATVASAQMPTPVGELRAAFAQERAKSVEGPERKAADELAERAETAAKANDARVAAKLFRDARIALPRDAVKLPEHVARIIGAGNGLRHADRVTGLSFSPDGKRLASSSRDGLIHIWSVGNERLLFTYRGHIGATEKVDVLKIAGLVFAPDGKRIASCGGKEIHLWDAETGMLNHKLAGHSASARGLAFTPDGKRLISGGDDRVVIVWDVESGEQLFAFPQQQSRIEAVAVQAQAKTFATVNSGGELHVFPLGTTVKPALWVGTVVDGGEGAFGVAYIGTTVNLVTAGGDGKAKQIAGPEAGTGTTGAGVASHIYAGNGGKFYALAASADGRKFITAGSDPMLRLWDAETGKLTSATVIPGTTIAGENRETGLSAAALSADGRWMAAGTVDGLIQIHPAEVEPDGRKLAERADVLYAVAVSPSGKVAAVAGADRTIALIDTASGTETKILSGHAGAVPTLTFVRENLLASGSGDKLLKLWDTGTGKAIDCAGHTSAVLCVAADAAGKTIASGSADRTVRLWDETGKPLGRWDANSAVTSLALTADGKRLFVGTANGLLTVVDPAGKEPKAIGSAQAHGSGTSSISIRSDGKRVLSGGGDGFARIWDLAPDGKPKLLGLLMLPTKSSTAAPPLTTVAFSPDGQTALTAGADRILRLWDANTFAELRTYRGHGDWITAAGFAPSGRQLVTASADKTVRSFDLPSATVGEVGHVGAVKAVAVSPSGKTIATAGKDRTIRLWTADGRPEATLVGSTGAIAGLGFLSDDRLVSTGDDGRLRIWSVADRHEVRSVPVGEIPVTLVVDAASRRIAVAVTRSEGADTTAGFLLYDEDGKSTGEVRERGRKIRSLSISADLRFGLSGGEDGSIRIWDLVKKEQSGGDWPLFDDAILDLGLAADGVALVALDPRGRRKIGDAVARSSGKPETLKPTASLMMEAKRGRHAVIHDDGTVTLCDNTGKTLRTWKLPSQAGAVAFAPDGKTLIAAQPDGTAWILTAP